ncbi:MAG: helix-turn-helix domain-containing protein [Chloroflexi bacterium]|nr:helix-turn-helix domain-containing protein [Chloroflexota bacterium]MCI0576469.1 helix-turn-helix domain-containing protein [Chloroflexota bacterium]MCI0649555.1 helix-turn-helix domain-containing protein [Chloroflexota bacterium]MCI0729369.1 helix-turn-helix domain-containing protein [Chloroflexota bacterium]
MKKAELIIHPVRLRILQVLAGRPLSTQDMAKELPDVAKSSLYRHVKLLLNGGLLAVAETRLINGIEEKIYQLAGQPHLSQEDLAGATATEHLQYLATFVASLLQGFNDYLEANPHPDLAADRVGYSATTFWATPEELDAFGEALRQAFAPLMAHGPGGGRRQHRLAFISYPVGVMSDEQ